MDHQRMVRDRQTEERSARGGKKKVERKEGK
jgi:hypothetical protein